MLPRTPPVGANPSWPMKSLRLSPSTSSGLCVRTASVASHVSNSLGIVPYG